MTLRKIGRNIERAMSKAQISLHQLSEVTKISENDLKRALEGRLLLPAKSIKKIAATLKISVRELLDTSEVYTVDGHNIKDGSELEKILDIIDDYSDLLDDIY